MRPRYFEWDYELNLVKEYKRKGKCKKCGSCCRAKIVFQSIGHSYRGDKRNGSKVTNGIGLWQEVNKGKWRYFYKIISIHPNQKTCQDLNNDNNCQVYENKANICKDWPFSPICINQFPNCGYYFNEINEWKINELEAA